ncbi:trihelix transcription factor GT-3b-like isoform X1 [Cotesia glomerata]|uniref:Myb/SANT-like DNA-binding domain-containing protein n=1 Tax=Cotesia glomerata TaxID=32391 RepID=A0AAV7J8E2_COTGL|nr:trihelix transcription factor GT-3b-like isoform X1 [Cotesia glomerata]KAH0568003.1 hypothetical protein KQX54_017265 [Cotesia glomerata]
MFKCKYCTIEVSPENVAKHDCFINKSEIFIDDDNNFFYDEDDFAKDPRPEIGETTDDYEAYEILDESYLEEENEKPESLHFTGSIKKSSAMWTKDATLSLLSLYEANVEKLDHANKKTKLWNTISLGLKSIDLQYSSDQVKWKMNALLSKYKSCFDNNSRSGRDYQTFDYYDVIDEIMQKNTKFTATSSVRSSNPLKSKNTPVTNLSPNNNSVNLNKIGKSAYKEKVNVSEDKLSSSPSTNSSKDKTNATPRGTGSKIARQKVALEQEWLKHLKMNEVKAKADAELREKYLIQKREQNELKKNYLRLRTEELEQKKELEMQKLKSKQRRHEDILDMMKSLRPNNAREQKKNAYDSD